MSDRIERMRGVGIYTCPPWCTQPDGEDEQHVSAWRTFETNYGANITIQLWLPWLEEDGDGSIHLLTAEGRVKGEVLADITLDGLIALQDFLAEAQDDLETGETDEWLFAWDGAEDEEAAADQAAGVA